MPAIPTTLSKAQSLTHKKSDFYYFFAIILIFIRIFAVGITLLSANKVVHTPLKMVVQKAVNEQPGKNRLTK